MEPTRSPTVVFSLPVVCSCGRAMSGIVKVIVSFFFRKGEEVAIERDRSRVPTDKETHKGVSELRKHLTEFLGLREQAHQYWNWRFLVKVISPDQITCRQMQKFCNCDGWPVGNKITYPKG